VNGSFETLNLVFDAQFSALALGNLTVVSGGGAPPQERHASFGVIQDELEQSYDPSFLLPFSSQHRRRSKASTLEL
jgi:hypothetical protein